MTAILGLLGSGLGPAGIAAVLVAATVSAWVSGDPDVDQIVTTHMGDAKPIGIIAMLIAGLIFTYP